MRILLDTHAFLWFSSDDSQLSDKARYLIEDPDNVKLLSPAVGWEMAIKLSKGRLHLKEHIEVLLQRAIQMEDWQWIDISIAHLSVVSTFPYLPSTHKDPFDRLLAAQAFFEGATLVSRDDKLDAFGVSREW